MSECHQADSVTVGTPITEGNEFVLYLNARERHVLSESLANCLDELRTEINDTDSRAYREGLKEREAVLAGVLQRVNQPTQAAQEPLPLGSAV